MKATIKFEVNGKKKRRKRQSKLQRMSPIQLFESLQKLIKEFTNTPISQL